MGGLNCFRAEFVRSVLSPAEGLQSRIALPTFPVACHSGGQIQNTGIYSIQNRAGRPPMPCILGIAAVNLHLWQPESGISNPGTFLWNLLQQSMRAHREYAPLVFKILTNLHQSTGSSSAENSNSFKVQLRIENPHSYAVRCVSLESDF